MRWEATDRECVMRYRAMLLAVAVATGLSVAGCGSSGNDSASPRSTTSTRPTTTTTTPATTAPSTTTTTQPDASKYVPLFPFANLQEVAAWQQNYRANGSQAQYLDARATALAFTKFLGYTAVDRVVSSRDDTGGAHVSVGYQVPQSDTLGTAAVIHLIRYGSGTDVPWEVVGTDDTDFSLTTPAYGATVGSPVQVGGTISGVDENIKVVVEQLHSNGYLGESSPTPAGGTNTPWSVSVTFAHPTDPVFLISASTGGHTQSIERFTITAVRTA